MIPSSGQAALGIEIVDNEEIERIVSVLNDEDAIIETTIERDFIRILEGGCQVPIGVNAEIQGTQITVKAILGLPDGSQMIVQELVGNKEDYKLLGEQLAQKVIDEGAKELLKRAETIALNEIF